MSANLKSSVRHGERGNAMVYVIIVIALFAALTFILSRQGDTGESSAINTEKARIAATSVMQGAAYAQQSIERLTFGSSALSCIAGAPMCDWDTFYIAGSTRCAVTPDDRDMRCPCARISFMLPSNSDFNNETPSTGTDEDDENTPACRKVFHPDGGGLSLPRLPTDALAPSAAPPEPGFYIGRFSNVEWSPEIDDPADTSEPPLTAPADDVMIVAYKIRREVCERINMQLTGATTIPALGRAASAIFINNGSNTDFTVGDCAACEGRPALCVQDPGGVPIYTYYSLILAKDGPAGVDSYQP